MKKNELKNKKLTKTGIEYGNSAFNTVIGCRHNCPWSCWAKAVSTTRLKKKYGGDFSDIQWLPERLDQPLCTKKPQRVLVNFMGDMWGDWVPHEWIDRTLDMCDAAPQHDYMFLTKNPKRYGDYITHFSNGNCNTYWKKMVPWLGTSVESGEKRIRLKELMEATDDCNCIRWVSLEPLIGNPEDPLDHMETYLSSMDWVVIGALTGKGGKQPEEAWVRWITGVCQDYGIPYFIKENLDCEKMGIERVQEYPRERKVA